MTYEPKTEFWTAQQLEGFDLSKDAEYFGLFMEQRTGKTKIILDTAARLYELGLIKGLLVVAFPQGVHENWVVAEAPLHIPDRIPYRGFTWFTSLMNRKSKRVDGTTVTGRRSNVRDYEEMLAFDGLKIFAINAEALRVGKMGLNLRTAIGRFVKACGYDPNTKRARILCAADESTFMQTPGKPRARIMRQIGKIVGYRRILDGTPITNQGPMGLYTQLKFLSPSILGETGVNYAIFRAHYAELVETGDGAYRADYEVGKQIVLKKDPNTDPKTLHEKARAYALSRGGRSWIEIAHDDEGKPIYKNIDELQARMAPYVYRARFRDCFPNVPPPVYRIEQFDLTAKQRAAYDELANEYRTELSGVEVTADMALTRYMRLQQITSNYWPAQQSAHTCEHCGGDGCNMCDNLGVLIKETDLIEIDSYNPRLSGLLDIVANGDPWIVWARFDQEVDYVLASLKQMDISAVRYDGHVSAPDKRRNREAFQAGHAQVFVAKVTSAGRGIPLWRARGMVFMSNIWSLVWRLQGEMRTEIAHRRVPSEIIDFVARDTVDDKLILPSLRANKEVADVILGDPRQLWI